jgi:glycosyltransferase involved in cell wall biosynthesis
MLLISVAYPPNAEVGALRWQKIAQAARLRGWTIDVILIDPTDPSIREEGRLQEVPEGAELYDVPLREVWAQRAERVVRRWIAPRAGSGAVSSAAGSGNAAPRIDDASFGQGRAARAGLVGTLLRSYRTRVLFAQWNDWARRAAAVGIALAGRHRYALVASSGPPHVAHEAARQVAVATGLPLVIDLRDPWFSDDVEPPALRGATWRALTAAQERAAVTRAALVVVNTDSCRQLMADRYPEFATRFLTVMNGADADVAGVSELPETFIISHTGSLYSGRDPRILFRAVARVVQRLQLTPRDLRVHFMGDDVYEGRPLFDLAVAAGVGEFTRCDARRPRAEALALVRASAMVVLLPQQHVHSIPGKVFEYVQLAAWPLILSDPGTATERLLRDSGADVLPPDDEEGVARAIEARYQAFRRGERPTPLNADGRFNRSRQAATLLDALDSLA